MLKSLARTAGFLAYVFITLEMLFMVTPFALYYYSAYAPMLSAPSNLPAVAWLPAFFLPHLSTEIIPSIGGLIFLVGLVGFLVGAFQIYYAKFRRRGVVKSGFYGRVRHPQYSFLALAGLGLLIVWPRFILLIIYIHMLWFYYLLARQEEERMRSRYGDLYIAPVRGIPMFLPAEPGGRLARLLFGWIPRRRLRLFAIYCLSLVASIGGAFALRQFSLRLIPRVNLWDGSAVISFLPGDTGELSELVHSARTDEKVRDRLNQQDGGILVQAMEGKPSVVHVMIDAGMTRGQAKNLPLAEKGVKLVFLQRKDRDAHRDPFKAGVRWQPAFIVELDGRRVTRVVDLNQASFPGNPLMPIF
jgi:protein-S-isoprenylcysteine O-methyltransferase Ste14